MKTVAAVLAFACLAQCAFGVVPAKECRGAPTTQCSAVSTLEIEATRGMCQGRSSANCKTWEQSQRAFQQAFEEWWSESDKVCDGNTVQAAAQTIATAIAKVWTSAAVAVECDEKFQGFSCGWSFVNARPFSASLAEAIATAAANASSALDAAGNPGAQVADSFCFADIRAIGGAFAKAGSRAHADACQRTGEDPAVVYEISFVSAIQSVIATALARASVGACLNELGADVIGLPACADDERDENFCLGLNAASACEGKGESTCCTEKRRDSRSRLCAIRGCRECKGPWKKPIQADGSLLWQNTVGEKCFCKDL